MKGMKAIGVISIAMILLLAGAVILVSSSGAIEVDLSKLGFPSVTWPDQVSKKAPATSTEPPKEQVSEACSEDVRMFDVTIETELEVVSAEEKFLGFVDPGDLRVNSITVKEVSPSVFLPPTLTIFPWEGDLTVQAVSANGVGYKKTNRFETGIAPSKGAKYTYETVLNLPLVDTNCDGRFAGDYTIQSTIKSDHCSQQSNCILTVSEEVVGAWK